MDKLLNRLIIFIILSVIASCAQVLEPIELDIEARDKRDSIRIVAPLKQSKDSNLVDTTLLNITEVVNKILKQYSEINIKSI